MNPWDRRGIRARKRLGATVAALLAGVSPAAGQTTRHVAPCGNNAWTGLGVVCTAPDGPKKTIQAAVNASAAGDTVVVLNGTYTGGGNRHIDFGGRNITLRSQNGPTGCILDAQGTPQAPHRVFYLHRGENRNARIVGFTITGGVVATAGGAMLLSQVSPTISDCVFRGNGRDTAPIRGGAVASFGGEPYFEFCLFEDNRAEAFISGRGAAAAVHGAATFRKCTFRDQSAGFGGAIYGEGASLVLMGCLLTSNQATYNGGAIRTINSTVSISRCTISGNTADRSGAIHAENSDYFFSKSLISANGALLTAGAIFCAGSLELRGCRLVGNELWTGVGGGAVACEGEVLLSECLLTDNVANYGGCAVDAPEAQVVIRGCTIAHNGPSTSGSALWLTSSAIVANSIVWANDAPMQLTGTPNVRYSIVQGGFPGPGNISVNPMFADASGRLSPGSPGIDAGSNAEITPGSTLDLDEKPRRRDDSGTPDSGNGIAPVVDIGAFEFAGTTCRPDCNLDGALTAPDIQCFNDRFQQGHPYADFNRDGAFSAADHTAFNAAFAAGCP